MENEHRFWKVISATTIDEVDASKDKEVLKAYKWQKFDRPIQYKPDVNGSIYERMQAVEERTDKISFRVENRAQFVEGINVYLEPEVIANIFKEYNGQKLYKQERGQHSIDYQIHMDPAVVNDMFSVMVAHTEKAQKPDEFGFKYKHLVIDWYTVYKPSDFEDGRISYEQVIQDVEELMSSFRPTIVSSDQFNSAYIIESLAKYAKNHMINCQVYEETATNAKNNQMYENMKFSANNGLIHSYYDDMNEQYDSTRCMLQVMLEQIQYVNGKIVKPRSSEYGHLDLCDCLAVLCNRMLGDQSIVRRDAMTNASFIDNASVVNDRKTYADLARMTSTNSPIRFA